MAAPSPEFLELSRKGLAHFQAGRYEEAASEFRAAVKCQPGLAQGHCNLGSALAALGHLAEAQSEFEAALYLEPGHPVPTQTGLGSVSPRSRPG